MKVHKIYNLFSLIIFYRMPTKYIAQHWHFYQPRNNDFWAERVNAECYKPNSENGILRNISYNIGPTLIDWLEKNDSKTLENMISADRGQVIGQTYNHRIMPLIRHDEDLKTQIIWGKRHFVKYFNREPKGIWLPETATDKRVCKELVNQGIKYTIGAWWQGSSHDGRIIDTKDAYNVDLGDGKRIIYFFFDPISSEIAFNSSANTSTRFLDNADVAIDRILRDIGEDGFMLLAYDGETFGHHHKFADKWAAYFPNAIRKRQEAKMVTLDEYIESNPPQKCADIIDNSSWSCLCGDLGRWSKGCSCAGGDREYQEVLLSTLEAQEDRIHDIFVSECEKTLYDVWDARNDYIDIKLGLISEDIFLKRHSKKRLSTELKKKIIGLLEAEYLTQLSFTSCGWFFPEVNIQTINNISDAKLAALKIESSTGLNVSENLKNLDWMLN